MELSKVWQLRSRFANETFWDVELISAKTTDLVAALIRGEMEASIVVGPIQSVELESTTLYSEPFIVGLPSEHALGKLENLTFEDIKGESVIWMPRSFNPVFYDYVVARCAELGFSLRPKIEVTTLQECLRLIGDRFGITLTTASAQSLTHAGVIFRPLQAPVSVDTVASYRRDLNAEFLRFFLDVTRRIFAQTDSRTT